MKSYERLYAEELGISLKRLKNLGGADRLRAMSHDARAIMVKPATYGSQQLSLSLAARKMVRKIPARYTQDQEAHRWTA